MMMDENQLEHSQSEDKTDSDASESAENGMSNFAESESFGENDIPTAAADTSDVTMDAAMPSDVGSPAAEETLPTEANSSAVIADLSREVETLKAQVEDRTAQYMRIAADFDNFRKRNQKERQDLELQVKCNTITELLPVVDNFERARSQIKPQTEQEMTIHKSYQSVYKQLVDCLKRLGVSPMRAEGKEFDPNLHEAVMREPTDQYEEGTVMEELVRGYVLGERVLRHAMVKVAAVPEPMATSEESDSGNAIE